MAHGFKLDKHTMTGLIERLGGADAAEVDRMLANVKKNPSTPNYEHLSHLPPVTVQNQQPNAIAAEKTSR